jgi:acyl CoA:acetate/3-ketoacid CoA transferase beta subunit
MMRGDLEKHRQIAWRAAQDLADGDYVNLGIGLPTLVADSIPADRDIVLPAGTATSGSGWRPAPPRSTGI